MKYLLILFFGLVFLLFNQVSFASEMSLHDQKTCEDLLWLWVAPNTCQIPKKFGFAGEITIHDNVTLEIPHNVTLTNYGTMVNLGEIKNNGVFDNDEGTIDNKGTITNTGLIKNIGGILDSNYGTILGSGTVTGHVFDSPTNIISPLKQSKSGIPVEKIRCNESRILVTKYDGSPACVKPETKPKLMQRNWIENSDGITTNFSFCGAAGFDSDGNPNKSNSTHFWDVNYCKWWPMEYVSSLDPEEKDRLQLKTILDHCNSVSLGLEEYRPYLQYENETHIITTDSCDWRKMHLSGNAGN